MKDIKELYAKIYGETTTNEKSIDVFIDYLDKRLTYQEKVYLFNEYGVDLINQKEIENHIIRMMRHPIIVKEVTKEN